MYGAATQMEKMNYQGLKGGIYAPRVQIGDRVVVKYLETNEKRDFLLSGDRNGSFCRGMITISSPMGSAVFSKSVGKVLEVRTPVGLKYIQIIDIKKPY